MQPSRQKTPSARTAKQQGGKVAKEFEAIKRQSIELGDVLPGTTVNFMNLGRVLKEQGLQPDVIAGGALKAAAYTNVVLDTPQEFGGEFIAKLMEARGVRDADLMRATDLIQQRARFGFGRHARHPQIRQRHGQHSGHQRTGQYGTLIGRTRHGRTGGVGRHQLQHILAAHGQGA